jgi:hypothetical protein
MTPGGNQTHWPRSFEQQTTLVETLEKTANGATRGGSRPKHNTR